MDQIENTPTSRKELEATNDELPKPLNASSLLKNLDSTIAWFGDGHILTGTQKQENQVEEGIIQRFAPPGLEEPFKQLYSILFPALFKGASKNTPGLDGSNTPESTFPIPVSSSSAAILMGVKGSGKTLLLEGVLMACRKQLQHYNGGRRLYRVVEINGIVCRGEEVGTVVYEMIRQLSGMAYRSIQIAKKRKLPTESPTDRGIPTALDEKKEIVSSSLVSTGESHDGNGDNQGNIKTGSQTVENEVDKVLLDTRKDDEDDDEDGSIVSDEGVKEFQARKRRRQRRKQRKIDKHMLRVRKATYNSNLSLLESTLKLAAVDEIPILLNLDELDSFTDKEDRQTLLYHFLDRVATPGSNLILIGMTSSFSALTLLEKRIRSRAEGTAKIIYLRPPTTYEGLLKLIEYKLEGCVLRKDILDRLTHPQNIESVGRAIMAKHKTQEKSAFAKDSDESMDVIHKLSIAMEREFRMGKDVRWFSRVIATSLSLYRHDFLVATSTGEMDSFDNTPPPFSTSYLWNAVAMMGGSVFDATAASLQPDLCIIDDVAVSPRLQALFDLSTPQVALLLSARRILKREEHREQAVLAPLTMERMLKEYESYRRGSISKGSSKLLKRAASQLMQQGLLVPSIDHSGGGALQYDVSKIYRDLDHYTLCRLPIQIPFDVDREIGKALDDNLLECPTALKEWGKSISKK